MSTRLCAALAALTLLSGCHGDDEISGDTGLEISMTSTPPSAGTASVVWLQEGPSGGDVLVAEILARDITEEFDSFNLEILFDPVIVQARSYESGDVLDGCAMGLPVLKLENLASGDADATASMLITESITAPLPPGCTINGTRTLGRITFRARGRGRSMPAFVPFNMDPNNPEGSFLARRDPAIPAIAVTFFDSAALIEVTGG